MSIIIRMEKEKQMIIQFQNNMDNNENFFVDVIGILPVDIECYIQAPSLEDRIVLNMMHKTQYDYYKCINLNEINRKRFIERLRNETVVEYFHSIEIKKNSKLLFEGYDGIESGIFSKHIHIPDWFKEKYKEDWDYSISKDWQDNHVKLSIQRAL